MTFEIGVDEAGRGPLAGPVAVGLVRVPTGFDVAAAFPGVADSKKLSEKNRERIFALLAAVAADPVSDVAFTVAFGSHEDIDTRGIAPTIRDAVARGIRALNPNVGPPRSDIRVLLDGALRAPSAYPQETIIGGDASVPLISLASIAAKVTRDRLMKELSLAYPAYGFEMHKGYGTKAHYAALRAFGPCAIHRRSFLHLDAA